MLSLREYFAQRPNSNSRARKNATTISNNALLTILGALPETCMVLCVCVNACVRVCVCVCICVFIILFCIRSCFSDIKNTPQHTYQVTPPEKLGNSRCAFHPTKHSVFFALEFSMRYQEHPTKYISTTNIGNPRAPSTPQDTVDALLLTFSIEQMTSALFVLGGNSSLGSPLTRPGKAQFPIMK